jgi:hypothetical protein
MLSDVIAPAPDRKRPADAMDTDGASAPAPGSSIGLTSAGSTPVIPSALLSQVPILLEDRNVDEALFPQGACDVNGQQVRFSCAETITLPT